MTAQTAPTKVVTKKVRLVYPNVFKPRPETEEIDPGKYTCMVLIPKSDTETVAKIKAACKQAIAAKWGDKAPSGLRNPLKDGDEKEAAFYRGNYYMNAKSNNKPGVVDRDTNAVLDPGELVSGDWGRASITFAAYDTAGNKGVGCYLNNLQVIAKGEPIGTFSRAEDDFSDSLEEVEDDAFA